MESYNHCINKLIQNLEVVTDELNNIIRVVVEGGQTTTQALVDMSQDICQHCTSNVLTTLTKGRRG